MRKSVEQTYNKVALFIRKGVVDNVFANDNKRYVEIPAVLSLVGNVKNKVVLDLGCGTGTYTKLMKEGGAKVYGLDISPGMISIARENVKGVDFELGTAYKMPYNTSFFDVIISSLVVEHFEKLDRAFREIWRVLKKDGIFVFSLMNPVTDFTSGIKGRPLNYRVFRDYFKEGHAISS